MTYADVCEIARMLPGIEESTSYGTPALKVRGKLLVRLKEDGANVVLRTTFVDRDFLMRAHPETLFITDHYRDYPWVLVRLATAPRALFADLLEDAWRAVAPKRMVDELDAAAGGPSPGRLPKRH